MPAGFWRHRRHAHEEDLSAPGLDHLLDSLRAPATAAETAGEREMAAALAAERRRALAAAPPPATAPPPAAAPPATRRLRPRTVVAALVAAAVALTASGTAVAARSGNLPAAVQERAHRLFSDFGVPEPARRSTRPTPPPPSRTATPSPAPTPAAPAGSAAEWCEAWRIAEEGGHPMNGRDRRDLIAAADGADKIAAFCGTAPTADPTTTKPGSKPTKSKKPKPSKG